MSFYFQPPDLAEFPRRSYRRFMEETIGNLLSEISPICSDFNPRSEISFVGQDGKVHWRFEDYAYDSGYPTTADQARKTNMTHARRLQLEVWLRDLTTNELRKTTAYMGDLPVITDRGTFVINGSERVVLGQLVRAPGVYFQMNSPMMYKGLILAELGAPVSIELDLETGAGKTSRAKCRIKLPKRGWVAATTVLTAMGVDPAVLEKRLIPLLRRHKIESKQLTQTEALAVLGRAWKPDGSGGTGGGVTALKELTERRRYSMGSLGRRRFNAKLGMEERSLQMTSEDLLSAVEYLLGIPLGNGTCDNIDSLENRHLRGIGDVLTKALRPALAQMTKSIRTRLELHEEDDMGSPADFIDSRPFVNAINKFFSGNPLVQYLDQQNPLSELSHRRRITSFGPGGIDPNAAPTEMRDVHPSQIGRVCLVESPEGKNCGMVSYLATYCRIDDDGFLTVPYRRVTNGLVTDEVCYLTPSDDKKYILAPPDTKLEGNKIVGTVQARSGESFFEAEGEDIDMIGIAPQGFLSVGSGLIPFLEHDDANRALMGGGMMRQTLPLVRPERPRVGTGMEKIVARSSGHSLVCRRAGTVTMVSGNEIKVRQASGEMRHYPLVRFDRTNQNTILDQRPNVKVGDTVQAGQIIADGPASDQGELALGRNLLIAFLSWNGYNYEDAIVVRQGLIRDHKVSHIEIEKHSIGVHQTLRGPEILTPELSNVAPKDLEHLDDRGIAKIGSYVNPGDILVSKLSPKEARALSAEEELLQAIFGKVAEEMADTSLRVPHGSGGRVIDIRIFTPETTPELKAGLICEIEVLIARLCPLEVGDKLAGRHGNKGIVANVVPDEDMPYLPDGTPVDLVLNPLGVPSRMNVGQVFDTQLGLYSSILNRYYRIHQFDESISPDASYRLVREALAEVRKTPGYEWFGDDGKVVLRDGRTGESFDRPVLVGRQYMLKLNQLVLHKINARSGLGGPYAAVTQQPVGGKANHGGQRMGEMEVWAIQAYGASHLLNEMMTIKSDDIQGRHQAYADIVQGKDAVPEGRTAAFDGLCCELRGLGLEVTLGKIVDSHEPIADKSCAQTGQPPRTLEEEYQVSQVHQIEEDGRKALEVPAGDYEPVVRPQPVPIIASLANARDKKAKADLSLEPLIDDVADEDIEVDAKGSALLADFISSETEDLVEPEHFRPKKPAEPQPAATRKLTSLFGGPTKDTSFFTVGADEAAPEPQDAAVEEAFEDLPISESFDELLLKLAEEEEEQSLEPEQTQAAAPVMAAEEPAAMELTDLDISESFDEALMLEMFGTKSVTQPAPFVAATPEPVAETIAKPVAETIAALSDLDIPESFDDLLMFEMALQESYAPVQPQVEPAMPDSVVMAPEPVSELSDPNIAESFEEITYHEPLLEDSVTVPPQPVSLPQAMASAVPANGSGSIFDDLDFSVTISDEKSAAQELAPPAQPQTATAQPVAEPDQGEPMVDFPSISELTSLTNQMARLRRRELEMQDDEEPVTAKADPTTTVTHE